MKIVIIGGKKRNGKDTHASRLEDFLIGKGLKVNIEHFATPLKSILIEAGIVTGLEDNKAKERPMFQRFGNDVMKKWFGNNVWADAMKNLLDKKTDVDVVIIPDFRYPCESEVLSSKYEVFSFHVERLGYKNEVDTHSSENALKDFEYNRKFTARGTKQITENAKVMAELIDA